MKENLNDRPWTQAEHQRHRKYGITPLDYSRMRGRQGGRCAICDRLPKKRPLDVDHDHASGEARGLLCNKCNRAIGLLEDDYKLLERAARYLKDGAHRWRRF